MSACYMTFCESVSDTRCSTEEMFGVCHASLGECYSHGSDFVSADHTVCEKGHDTSATECFDEACEVPTKASPTADLLCNDETCVTPEGRHGE